MGRRSGQGAGPLKASSHEATQLGAGGRIQAEHLNLGQQVVKGRDLRAVAISGPGCSLPLPLLQVDATSP